MRLQLQTVHSSVHLVSPDRVSSVFLHLSTCCGAAAGFLDPSLMLCSSLDLRPQIVVHKALCVLIVHTHTHKSCRLESELDCELFSRPAFYLFFCSTGGEDPWSFGKVSHKRGLHHHCVSEADERCVCVRVCLCGYAS